MPIPRNVRVVSFLAVAMALFVGGTGALMPQLLRQRERVAPEVFRGTTSLFEVPLAGGRPKEVLRLRGQWDFPVATRDGKAILLEQPTTTSGTTVWRVPLDGSPKTRVGWKRVFTPPAAWHEPTIAPRVADLLDRLRLADFSPAPGGHAIYAVRLNQAVSIPK